MSNRLVLIDGHALAYRMFYAMPADSFKTKTGEPTGAVFGFVRTVLHLMFSDDPPDHIAVCFDVGKTFRDELFPAYKGTREKMPDELRGQIERIQQCLERLAIPILTKDQFEADDVIGTIAHQAQGEIPVYIITGDRDLLQLVDENTTIELPPTRKSKTPRLFAKAADVKAAYGVLPVQIPDWKALEGDSSDNIPGVKGVGNKTALKLLAQYPTLEEIYANLEDIQPSWRKKLESDKENAFLSKLLATIVRDVPVELDLSACKVGDFDESAVVSMLQELEFRSLTRFVAEQLDVVVEEPIIVSQTENTETIIVRTAAQLDDLVTQLTYAEMIAFDVETTGLDKMSADLVGICLSVLPPTAYYIPVGHISNEAQAEDGQMGLFAGKAELAPDQLPLETVLDAIRPAMTNPDIPKVAHNAKFDYIMLHRAGLTVSPIGFDTMIGEWLVNPNSLNLGLKNLAWHRLQAPMRDITELIGTGKKQRSFAEVGIDEAAVYGSVDAHMTYELVAPIRADLEDRSVISLLDMEMALIPILAEMEMTGIGVDHAFFAEFNTELSQRTGKLAADIEKIAGKPFNLKSTQQLSDVLFTDLALPSDGLKKTKSGHFSTASNVLEGLKLVDTYGIIDKILTYRELEKLDSTYVKALPKMVNKTTGRVHTSFNQTGAVTGRLSSNSPNLQNIPIRTEIGRKVRQGFVAKPGHLFIAADYSQVELRILAHVSQDEALLDAFRENLDVHKATAAAVYGIPLDDVDFNQRRFAKAVNFGLMYGMGPYRLARDSDLTLAEAENFIKAYFEQFPGVRRYLDETKEIAKKQGYVETLLGRRQYFPDLHSNSKQAVARAERVAINHPIQGTAADMIKRAMITLSDRLKMGQYAAKMLLQVHDELILELPEAELNPIMSLVVDTMSNAYELDVPLKVDAAAGINWFALKA